MRSPALDLPRSLAVTSRPAGSRPRISLSRWINIAGVLSSQRVPEENEVGRPDGRVSRCRNIPWMAVDRATRRISHARKLNSGGFVYPTARHRFSLLQIYENLAGFQPLRLGQNRSGFGSTLVIIISNWMLAEKPYPSSYNSEEIGR